MAEFWRWAVTGLLVSFALGSAIFMSRSKSSKNKPRKMIPKGLEAAHSMRDKFRNACATPVETLRKISQDMLSQMEAGLQSDGESRLRMLLSFVEHLPCGNETGLFYGLDLGGTNFRVLRVQLGGKEKRILKQESKVDSIPSEIMTSTNEELFDYIARVLADFVATEGVDCNLILGQKRELGFTFSFPVSQESLNSGKLVKWTKGFAIAETIGQDVVKELQAAMERCKLDMHVIAMVNDTTGTLAGGRYWNEDVMAGLILGTGSNACYVEQTSEIPKWPPSLPKPEETVINIEWGHFWSPHIPKTEIDDDLDAESVHPGQQVFEKLFSGMYLGDIVRRMILKLAEQACLLGGVTEIPSNMATPFVLRTRDVSIMHEDESENLENVARVMETIFGLKELPLEVRKVIKDVCEITAARGARLVAAGIVGIVRKIGGRKKKICIAIDGSLYEHYTKFRAKLHEALVELLGQEAAAKVVIELSKDGSGLGAALLAASHSKKDLEDKCDKQ
ncbi:hexokinase-7 [Selaginella moellendorffii]|uniref:hexokinase-7 n=1 Tax=Selaginella moellendorffii TaxID=88036 RepID=UPI000D1CB170|nr:hexokinase-7 [Selaginella moellendorffii]|eukprot:XP_024517345.1 hexokinase-7 [Selaginella moellendorffii]